MSLHTILGTAVLLLGSFFVNAQATHGYINPVLRGVNPDPSICNVGDDFYMVTSSMFLYPGVPIYHSKDLVSWKQIGYCLTTPQHFFLDRNNNSPMLYAATLRCHNGTFYMITTDVHGGGNFYVTAKNPAGPWSVPVIVDAPVFDPSLFFDDDGKVYYTRRGDFKDKDIGTRHSGYDSFSAIGRETFLLPVTWVNDWPVVKLEHRVHMKVNTKTIPLKPWMPEPVQDDFNESALALKWNLLDYPATNWYSLSERKGFLRLKGTAEQLRETKQVAFVGCRQREMAGVCSSELEFTPTAENEEAGISVFQNGNYHYDLFLTIRNNKTTIVLRKTVGDLTIEAASISTPSTNIKFRIELDPDLYHFKAEVNGEWKELGIGNPNLIATEVAQVWSGVFIGMYSSGNGKPCNNPADFNWFKADFKEVVYQEL